MVRGSQIMTRVALVACAAFMSFGYAQCTFISNPDGVLFPSKGNGGNGSINTGLTTTLTLQDSNGAFSTSFQMGEPIRFNMQLLNQTNQTVTLQFPDAQIYDFYVLDPASSQVIWRWAQDLTFAQVATTLSIAPYATQTYTVTWNGILSDGTQLTAGSYRARGVIVSDNFSSNPLMTSDLGSNLVNFTVQ
jgi:hypothetical protein